MWRRGITARETYLTIFFYDMTALYITIIILLALFLLVAILFSVRFMRSATVAERECAVLLDRSNSLTERLGQSERRCEELLRVRDEQHARIAMLESEMLSGEKRMALQKEQFETITEKMRSEFKNMAAEALQKNNEQFGRQSGERLLAMLQPFNIDLKLFREKVEAFYGEESRQRFSLQESIKNLVEANRRISTDAVNLTNALVGTRNNKFQGDWGETILEQILENSGLVEGEQWERQVMLRTPAGNKAVNEGNNKNMKPDVIVHFPGKRDIIIDSKVSLNSYMAYLASEDEASRSQALKEHVASVRRHIDELAEKSYDKYNIHSLDYVMLFIPNEPSYFVAMEADNSMWNYAYKKGIVLISPSNLISTLFVVNSLWTRERQQRDVQKIVDTANAVYEKFVGFTENFKKIEASLEKAMEAYNDAYKQLTSGKGNITRRLEEIKRQGLLSTNKQLPDYILEKKDD